MGGLGSAILEFSADNQHHNKIIRFGVPDNFIEHGSQNEQQKECGFDKTSILKKVNELLQI